MQVYKQGFRCFGWKKSMNIHLTTCNFAKIKTWLGSMERILVINIYISRKCTLNFVEIGFD